jgi:predicted membrane channel-forming protein YqfA (hemolysin III family)
MLISEGFSFANFIVDVFSIFLFVLWFWLFITVAADLFRRHDTSGLAKVLWVILLIVLPYIGIFAYILTQGRGMAERNMDRAKQAREELRKVVGFSVSDELEKLGRLKSSGDITEQEYTRLRAKLME